MKRLVLSRERFRLKKFLDALEAFAQPQGDYDGPLPVVHGGIAYHDDTELAIALEGNGENDAEGEGAEIPEDSIGRLEKETAVPRLLAMLCGSAGLCTVQPRYRPGRAPRDRRVSGGWRADVFRSRRPKACPERPAAYCQRTTTPRYSSFFFKSPS
jgi:hypothetical protein